MKPMSNGGSPSGVSRPPALATTRMKKGTRCEVCSRSELVRKSGRISSMLAPVVPITLAKTAPMVSQATLVAGVASTSVVTWMPLVVMNSAPSVATKVR